MKKFSYIRLISDMRNLYEECLITERSTDLVGMS